MYLCSTELFICIKMNLALNNLQYLICHKTKPNQTLSKQNHFRLSKTTWSIFRYYKEKFLTKLSSVIKLSFKIFIKNDEKQQKKKYTELRYLRY